MDMLKIVGVGVIVMAVVIAVIAALTTVLGIRWPEIKP
jgi:hypothetical protein